MEMTTKTELDHLDVMMTFQIVVTDDNEKRTYTVHYAIHQDKHRELTCMKDNRVCFEKYSLCNAPIADYERIQKAIAVYLKMPTEELLKRK